MKHTLGSAAKAVGLSKATLHRAVKSGKISAKRLEDGSYEIDPAELHRVYEPVTPKTGETGSSETLMRQSATPYGTGETDHETGILAVANARLEAELAGLKELLRLHREQVDDLRTERDRLLGQVEAAHRLLTHNQTAAHPEPVRRGWRFWR